MPFTKRDPGKYISVTPNDATNLPNGPTRGMCLAIGGDVAITYSDGDTDTLTLPAGIHPIIGVVKVAVTGTTASGISAIY